ncbi:MAG: hypothetical protein HN891_06565 [Planctomycetes bacterium]|jgi:hypothetical protein|nr:hypothetical protein [Planctomycetota bacterium]MBT7130356.1 hypothetical protein [Planctomycetota bacterium]
MKDFNWIYLLMFVVLPMLKNILESRSKKKKAAAKLLATRSAEDLQQSARISARQRGFPDPLSDAELTEAELEEDVQAWVDVQPGSTSPTAPAPTPLGGGWVEVSGAPTSVSTHSPTHPAMRLEPRSHLDPPQDPIDLLAQFRQELTVEEYEKWLEVTGSKDTSRSPSVTEDPYSNVEKRSSANNWNSQISLSGPALSSFTAAAQGRHKKQRLTLTRNQLRDRLLWREILGPPVSLRPPDESHL